MKKLLLIFSLLLCVGCNNSTNDNLTSNEEVIKYQLTINNEKGYVTYTPEESFFEAGEEIIIKTKIIPNFNLKMFVNDQFYSFQKYVFDYEKYVWQFSFNMPNENTTVYFEKTTEGLTDDLYLKDVTHHIPLLLDRFPVFVYYDNSYNQLTDNQTKDFIDAFNLMLNNKIEKVDIAENEINSIHSIKFTCENEVYDFLYDYTTHYCEDGIYISFTEKENLNYVDRVYKLISPSEIIVNKIINMLDYCFVTENNCLNENYDYINEEAFLNMFFEYDSDKNKRPDNFMLKEHMYIYNSKISSSSSIFDALEKVKANYYANSDFVEIEEIKPIEINSLYYGIYVKESYLEGTIFEDKYYISFNENKYDYDNDIFYTTDLNEMKLILDLIVHPILLGRSYIYHSNIKLIDGKPFYYFYYNTFSFGDSWGEVPSELNYYRRCVEFNDDYSVKDAYSQLILKTFIQYGL